MVSLSLSESLLPQCTTVNLAGGMVSLSTTHSIFATATSPTGLSFAASTSS